ncbi:S26 family signal peptidase [Candidatus Micrarchaeota archaeon]|nr:S26 family signal peptidase [Candidatus Micrarchaeota archaeon]
MNKKLMKTCVELFKEKNKGKKIILKTKGNSMFPLISENSSLEIEILPASELKTGDVITYYSDKKSLKKVQETENSIELKLAFFKSHRILKKKTRSFLVKGDNSWNFDPLVDEKNVLGRVTKINKKKTSSMKFSLTKMPLAVFSLATGTIYERIKKTQKNTAKKLS